MSRPPARPLARLRSACLLLVALALGACAGADGRGARQETGLGKNLVGEDCRLERTGFSAGEASYAVLCGRWEQPSARVVRLSGARQEEAATRLMAERSERMACASQLAAQTGIAGSIVLGCRLSRGGWEQIAVEAEVGGDRFLADGTPATLPAIARAITAVADLPAPDPDAGEGSGLALYDLGEVEGYDRLMRQASYQNSLLAFAEAENLYRQALRQRERVSGDNAAIVAEPMLHLALQVSNQERFREADALFDRATRLAELPDAPPSTARFAQFYRALHESNQGKADAALAILEAGNAELEREIAQARAAGIDRQLVLRDEELLRAYGDLGIGLYMEGRVLTRLRRYADAEAVAGRAEAVIGQTPAVPRRLPPSLRELRAEIAFAENQPGRAAALYGEAIDAWARLYKGSRPEALARMAQADALARAGEPAAALAGYRAAVTMIEARRDGLSYGRTRGAMALLAGLAEQRPDERAALHREMYALRQLVRGGVTAQSIALTASRLAAGDDAAGALIRGLQEAERARDLLYQEVNILANDEERAQDPETRRLIGEERTRAAAELDAAEREVAGLEPQVQAAFAVYNNLLDTPVTVDDALATLTPDEAAIDFLVGDDAAYVFVLRRGSVVALRREIGAAAVDALVQRVRASVTLGPSANLLPFDVEASRALYRELVEPTDAALGDTTRLVLVPSGPLASLPPGILVVDSGPAAADPYDLSRVRWLVERATLTVVPSIRSLVDLRRSGQPSRAPEPFLGFGDFVPASASLRQSAAFTRAGAIEGCEGGSAELGRLPAMPETADELRRIAAIVGAQPSSVRLGQAFTEKAVETADLGRYRILYFATHGLLPSELDCQSEPALAVTPTDEPGIASPGLLESTEVAKLRLDADLVVLSACNTAGPAGGGGESLSGLARSFFFAGARSLLVSHWSVPSEETVVLMTRSFEVLEQRQGSALAESLRRSQLDMIGTGRDAVASPGRFAFREVLWTHPFFWGAFTMIGASTG